MSPAVRGEMAHRIQFELLRGRSAALAADGLEAAYAALDAAVARVSAEYAERLAPAIPRLWLSEIEGIRVDLRGWIAETARAADGWAPAAAELSFGIPAGQLHDPHSSPEPVACPEGVLLKGSIDLVERNASGGLRVTDHKTGRPPDPPPQCIGRGEILQPLLYASAAEQLLKARVDSARLFYATLEANYRQTRVAAHQANRDRLARVLAAIDDAIYRGFLPAAPREDACRRCDYRPVCGPYEEERVARKAQEELGPLREVRQWP
jgi:hypothetical protein